jgi:predicted DNA binding protein
MTSSEPDTELLRTAVERGYFRVPRQTSLVDLADAHDISDVEASERLRTELDTALREHLDGVDATVASEHE